MMESQRPPVDAKVSPAGISCKVGDPSSPELHLHLNMKIYHLPERLSEVLWGKKMKRKRVKIKYNTDTCAVICLSLVVVVAMSWGQRSKYPDFMSSSELVHQEGLNFRYKGEPQRWWCWVGREVEPHFSIHWVRSGTPWGIRIFEHPAH